MWIRSQDKTILKDIKYLMIRANGYHTHNQIDHYEIIADYKESTHPNGSGIVVSEYIPLGKYKTKERALEILDDIQEKILEYEVIKNAMQNINVAKEHIEYIKTFSLYEMPEE